MCGLVAHMEGRKMRSFLWLTCPIWIGTSYLSSSTWRQSRQYWDQSGRGISCYQSTSRIPISRYPFTWILDLTSGLLFGTKFTSSRPVHWTVPFVLSAFLPRIVEEFVMIMSNGASGGVPEEARGTVLRVMCSLTQEIVVMLSVRHIPSKKNVLVDQLSHPDQAL